MSIIVAVGDAVVMVVFVLILGMGLAFIISAVAEGLRRVKK